MPRKIIPLATGETYHLFNRGVDKRKIFLDKSDYRRFLACVYNFNSVESVGSLYELRYKKSQNKTPNPLVQIHAYCILSNHFHLIVTQNVENGISEYMKRLGGGYTNYFNEKYHRSGSLFQGAFKRVHVQTNDQLLYLAAYVNLNNVVHNRNEHFESSFQTYVGTKNDPSLDTKIILDQFENTNEFSKSAHQTVTRIKKLRELDKKHDCQSLLE